ncbi:MAG: fructose-bisphosphate aldolase [Anaerosolibacter sp.]|jgi:fructose-bisphosphate aldolase class II|uniref:class II fructose-bisphosphate aldolase n=1 Tax=Anaerosolibacter sp. TaxID=1872527 RepID=UPI0026128F2E|nr:class II fructose-bisphosphate aldolase [Anaerosolibacter sp.]MDF2547873.1 fructose-bisphosphate aldolase [Anaerosolibacter sp.]
MPIVNYQQYCSMLDHAKKNKFAYVAVNVTSMTTANAAMKAFAEMKTDGIIQVSTGGAEFASGLGKEGMALGAISLANHIHLLAEKYNVYIALHTDHCQESKLDSFLLPLIEETEKRRAQGLPNLFNSHMFDGGELPLQENLRISKSLLERCAKSELILEIEAGVVGGEEDGVSHEDAPAEKLYTTPEDMLAVARELGKVPNSRFLLAATFGNVHGVYKPGNVKLRPEILKHGQDAIVKEFGEENTLDLVFHGGSGSSLEEIHETLEYGVVKMNVDTDMQYAFTRGIADHFYKNYDGILKIDGEVGNKKVYDPRGYLKKGEAGMIEQMKKAIVSLRSQNTTLFPR